MLRRFHAPVLFYNGFGAKFEYLLHQAAKPTDLKVDLVDSGSLELDSGFQSPGFRILQAKLPRIPESGFPDMGRNGGNTSEAFASLSIIFHRTERLASNKFNPVFILSQQKLYVN